MTPLELRLHEQLNDYEEELMEMAGLCCELTDKLETVFRLLLKVKGECPTLFYQAISQEELRKIAKGEI